jgi:hypothetical protein
VFSIHIAESCNCRVGEDVDEVAVVRVDLKALLRYLVGISITINPSGRPRVRGVQYDGTAMLSHPTSESIDILGANVKNPRIRVVGQFEILPSCAWR